MPASEDTPFLVRRMPAAVVIASCPALCLLTDGQGPVLGAGYSANAAASGYQASADARKARWPEPLQRESPWAMRPLTTIAAIVAAPAARLPRRNARGAPLARAAATN